MGAFMDMTGREFARLRVVGFGGWVGNGGTRISAWRCVCAEDLGGCGGETTVRVSKLKNGHTKSCGCLLSQSRGASSITHGASRGKTRTNKVTPEYSSWVAMRGRCNNANDHKYPCYGGRGITICSRWSNFASFLADVGPRPTRRHTIGRPRNDDGYWCGDASCPECGPSARPRNGRWETDKDQARNRRNNHVVEFDGQSRCLAEWGEITGIGWSTIASRIRSGWSVGRAMTAPVDARKSHKRAA